MKIYFLPREYTFAQAKSECRDNGLMSEFTITEKKWIGVLCQSSQVVFPWSFDLSEMEGYLKRKENISYSFVYINSTADDVIKVCCTGDWPFKCKKNSLASINEKL